MRSAIIRLTPLSWAFFWLMTVVSMKGSMIALWVFALLSLLHMLIRRPGTGSKQLWVSVFPAMLFLWYLITWFIHGNAGTSPEPLVRKSALLLLPLLMILARDIEGVNLKWAMRGLMTGLAGTGIHLIIRAVTLMLSGHGMSEYTYHAFTSPYEAGAIYYSWYLSIALIYLMYAHGDIKLEPYRNILVFFFMVLLLMSASKLFIIVMLPFAFWYFFSSIRTMKYRIAAIATLLAITVAGAFPVLERMQKLGGFSPSLVLQDEYAYDSPLDGLSLRLIQWRFGFEILNENNAWLAGAGLNESNGLLDQKYTEYGLYTGNPDLGDTGYLGYNFHNQFMETLVSTGMIGFSILLIMFAGAFFIYRKLLIFPWQVFLVTLLFFLTESVLERQAGILVFSTMISFCHTGEKN